MTLIELPDEQAMALKAKAAASGLSLEAWLKQLAAEPGSSAPLNDQAKQTGAAILEVLQSSPYREIDLTPPRVPIFVRDVQL
jgi:hypothetical protein